MIEQKLLAAYESGLPQKITDLREAAETKGKSKDELKYDEEKDLWESLRNANYNFKAKGGNGNKIASRFNRHLQSNSEDSKKYAACQAAQQLFYTSECFGRGCLAGSLNLGLFDFRGGVMSTGIPGGRCIHLQVGLLPSLVRWPAGKGGVQKKVGGRPRKPLVYQLRLTSSC